MKKRDKIQVAVRADGGPQIGMGHIMRCLALAKAMEKIENLQIIFISVKNSAVSRLIAENSYKVIEIVENKPEKEIEEVNDILHKHDINIVITDSYSFDRTYLERIGYAADVVVSIDDLNRIVFPSDIVINGNIYAPCLNYRPGRSDTEFLLGTDYVLLREEFIQKGNRSINNEVKHVLVSVGGSDPLNLTPKILQALDRLPFDFDVKVVIGPGFNNLHKIVESAGKIQKPVEVLHNVKTMVPLMMLCDLAVTGGGTTLYELSCTGTPAVTLLQADNQEAAAAEMALQGAVINMGMGDEVSVPELASAIIQLCADREKRTAMSKKGQILVDGYGCQRCALKILQKFHTKKGVEF
ncbi:UDP-2,4-diacetamido-2,4,6-trideoxy-beta-L-altropyranose hydrolase [Phosphitispora sp. TUW77]|uniref:UDP-2,4-diacetamido-2,4, 6-trideoxy-beta-L-altropyranose hydrolase n=1 Tax=Phosphitispora sp. TUW77 TaxID=3152361 RepID=UPI003AB8153C